jgi:hypothetical protein
LQWSSLQYVRQNGVKSSKPPTNPNDEVVPVLLIAGTVTQEAAAVKTMRANPTARRRRRHVACYLAKLSQSGRLICSADVIVHLLKANAMPYKPRPVFNSRPRPNSPVAATSEEDFIVRTSYAGTSGRFFGMLRVVRMTDGRTLFPFEGAPDIGPFQTILQATQAAKSFAERIVAGDLVKPEL